jgi:hypothetical protein
MQVPTREAERGARRLRAIFSYFPDVCGPLVLLQNTSILLTLCNHQLLKGANEYNLDCREGHTDKYLTYL